ncbi:FAD-dependent monooxygenase [Rhizobium sp. WW22]|uniref:FAD binding domain-containing protein n=1 Tax=unclassified Rhizobium TaxID=2613769 RepID=UPI000DD5872C|nr:MULTISPECIES: FAD-dependent monooxygenase [unclassified Rhizobium]MBB3386555.1 2-polyprenyl-6-methoxyphenol hydroxylase-like FAD-dependent oxidoreductase [Rhizobium sp. BK098]MBB3618259.1 2-polyprenyl-6-methoxyphenol hydroxylase-like FAD-dependent oxidoreductase [Rhizobium sp. BK609]MBB3683916.1 2-polyprenyl-6-methoxyphenol hydroxylase-like FAD-dependent oxidoreductase [Rhizobium sp. BK612]
MKRLRIRIVGGSLAGLFAGILLQRDGHDVKIYERSPSGLAGRGAGLVGQHDLFRILRAIGCEHVARVGVVAKERIYFNRDGSIAETSRTPQMQISWDFLYSTVASHMVAESYQIGKPVVDVVEGAEGAQLLFADGRREDADLVIGADGLGSVVRPLLNRDASNRFAGYVAWRGLIPETALPQDAAVLLDRFAFYVTSGIHVLGYLVPGPGGETGPGERRYNWVWYRPVASDELQTLFTAADGRIFDYSLPRGALSEERLQMLRSDAASMLPPPLVKAIEAESLPSIQGIFDFEATNIVSAHTAIIGDAAFVVRPHTAMGVSKAAGDTLALREALLASEDLSEALERYQKERLPVGKSIADYGRRLGASAL